MSNLKSHFINEVIGPLLVALIHIFELKNPISYKEAISKSNPHCLQFSGQVETSNEIIVFYL